MAMNRSHRSRSVMVEIYANIQMRPEVNRIIPIYVINHSNGYLSPVENWKLKM